MAKRAKCNIKKISFHHCVCKHKFITIAFNIPQFFGTFRQVSGGVWGYLTHFSVRRFA